MPLLKDFVYSNQCFEGLDFICEDGLPEKMGGDGSAGDLGVAQQCCGVETHTFMPAQKDCEDL